MFMRLFFTITVQWLVRQRHPVKCCVSHHLLARESQLSEKKKEERKKFIDRGYGLGCNYFRGFRY